MKKYIPIMAMAVILSGSLTFADEAKKITNESQQVNKESILLSDLGNAEIKSITEAQATEKSTSEVKVDLEALRESYQRRSNFNLYGSY